MLFKLEALSSKISGTVIRFEEVPEAKKTPLECIDLTIKQPVTTLLIHSTLTFNKGKTILAQPLRNKGYKFIFFENKAVTFCKVYSVL